jgi:hypothetical protein
MIGADAKPPSGQQLALMMSGDVMEITKFIFFFICITLTAYGLYQSRCRPHDIPSQPSSSSPNSSSPRPSPTKPSSQDLGPTCHHCPHSPITSKSLHFILCYFVYFHPKKVELGEMEATFLSLIFFLFWGWFVCLFVCFVKFFETFAILQNN